MSKPLDPRTIPPAPAVGQLWQIDSELYHVLSVAPGGDGMEVIVAVYSPTEPLTLLTKSFKSQPLRQFVERTHGQEVELVQGPGAPWQPKP